MESTVLGIDLGGAASATTGMVVLSGDSVPAVESAVLAAKQRPEEAESALIARILAAEADVVAIDAPLTLPPCLICKRPCSTKPGRETCLDPGAALMWRDGWNPISQRPCEVYVWQAVGDRPLPTMQLGAITARAMVLARRLERHGGCSRDEGSLIEVYPRATLRALARVHGDVDLDPRRAKDKEPGTAYVVRVLDALSKLELVRGIDNFRDHLSIAHVFDALVAAYTAWLGPGLLERPPDGWPKEAGWISIPHTTEKVDGPAGIWEAYGPAGFD